MGLVLPFVRCPICFQAQPHQQDLLIMLSCWTTTPNKSLQLFTYINQSRKKTKVQWVHEAEKGRYLPRNGEYLPRPALPCLSIIKEWARDEVEKSPMGQRVELPTPF